ncbi:MAG: response regulator [Gammaproteobacteria bacterium]|nr:response regulator [Gammaproteobacteria bacterium]
MDKQILTTGDVARYCNVNFRTVIRWIERGILNAYKLPGRGDNRISREDFIEFLQDNDMPVPAEFRPSENRVLVVEDDVTTAKIIQKVLEKDAIETCVVHDGFHAGIKLNEFSPAVVSLDLDIPGLKGLDVLRYIRKTDNLKHIKVLVVSGLPEAELLAAQAAGADDVLSKPIKPEVLQERMSRLLSSN